ncbi:MAG: M56 family metallopeptidase [Planctomycetaceae bacterium]|jgi:beta-lactamase regulating signal transducer with metallopeptidase domain|nr:M56 family metallopeptidase [Planctomycetaceae bacterium]
MTFVPMMMTSTILLAVTYCGFPFLRRQSAAVRHLCLCSVLTAILLLPFSVLFLPTITPVVPPVSEPEKERPVSVPEILKSEITAPVEMPPHAEPVLQETPRPVTVLQPEVRKTSLPWGTVVLFVWGMVMFFRLLRLAVSVTAVRKMTATAVPFPLPQEIPNTETIGGKFRIHRKIPVLTNPQVNIPFTAKIVHPVIFLPQSMQKENADTLRLVLMHETAHIARRDVFWQLLSRIVSAVYWFHPLVYWLTRKIRQEREFACDDAVLLSCQNRKDSIPEDYASVLLNISESLRRTPTWIPGCTVAMAQTHQIEKRIRAILDLKRVRRPVRRMSGLILILSICSITALAGMFSPFEAERKTPDSAARHESETVPADSRVDENKKVTIHGKVHLPQGVTLKDMPSRSVHVLCSYNKWQGYGISIDVGEDGNFQHDAPVSSWIMLFADSFDGLASKTVNTQVTAEQSPGQYDIHFTKGVPVRVKISYADGTPAERKDFSYRIDTPVQPGREIENMFFAQETHENGECRLAFQPGTYTFKLSDLWRNEDRKTITVAEGDQEITVDFTLPPEKKIRIVCEDGATPVFVTLCRIGFIEPERPYYFGQVNLDCAETGKDFFDFIPAPYGDIVSISANGGKYGIVAKIRPDTAEEVITMILFRTAKINGRLRDKSTGNPITNAWGDLQQYVNHNDKTYDIGTIATGVPFRTDMNGNMIFGSHASMHGYVGAAVGGEYKEGKLMVFKEHSLDKTLPLDFPAFQVTVPGELINLGDIFVENGASASK